MRALVVYESMFGNARTIAAAITNGLTTRMDVDLLEVGVTPRVINPDIDLLVVGGPTHMTGMTRGSSREGAARQAREAGRTLVSTGDGLREWLDALQGASGGTAAAVFCTRLAKPRWLRFLGSAGRAAEKRLRRLGFRLALPVEAFYVAGSMGPLLEGETERARRWGEALAARFVSVEPERPAA